jgi:hypothetical protein
MHKLSCMATYTDLSTYTHYWFGRGKAQRKPQSGRPLLTYLPTYLPTYPPQRPQQGPTCLRCELVRRRLFQRQTGAMSVHCAMARRVRACSAPPMSAHVGEAQPFVRSKVRQSTHSGTRQSTHSCTLRTSHGYLPSAVAAVGPANMQWDTSEYSYGVLYVLAGTSDSWYSTCGHGYCEYSHLRCAAVRSCRPPPRPAAAAVVPAHLQLASGRP